MYYLQYLSLTVLPKVKQKDLEWLIRILWLSSFNKKRMGEKGINKKDIAYKLPQNKNNNKEMSPQQII